MFCGKCGTKLKEGAAFCPECGNPVRGIPESPVKTADPDATVKVRSAYPESLRKASAGIPSGAAGRPPVIPDSEATVRTPFVAPSGRPPVRTAPEAPERPPVRTAPEVPAKHEKLISTMDSAVDPGQQEIFEKNFKPLGDL